MVRFLKRLRSRRKNAEGIRFTREGRRFLLAAFLIAFAAVNTGNNLIYLIFSLMLSFLLVSYIVLRVNLSGISIKLLPVDPLFAGETRSIQLQIRNSKRIPAYSLLTGSEQSEHGLYCGMVDRSGTFTGDMLISFNRRGHYETLGLSLNSGFPFILFRKTVLLKAACNIMVYPEMIDISDLMLAVSGRVESGEFAVRGTGDELYSLRSYQYGDDWRRIHWKASARQDSFVVREFAEYHSARIMIVLDNISEQTDHSFERAVSISASLAARLIDEGHFVRFVASGIDVPFGTGREHLRAILHAHAMIGLKTGETGPDIHEKDGFTIAVLGPAGAPPAKFLIEPDMVVHADTV